MQFSKLRALPSWDSLVLALLVLSAGLFAQPIPLELGKTIPGDLSGGQTQSYAVRVETNQYLRAVVTQPVAAVVIDLLGPDGKKALEVDTRNFAGNSPRIVWVAEQAGEHYINLIGAGQYEIKLEELRPAGADDRKRVEAERLFEQGLHEARKYAFDQAISSYTRALGLYRELQDRERQGDTLNAAGDAYDDSRRSEKAIGYYEQALETERDIRNRRGEGYSLNSLGIAYRHLNQNEKAIGYYEQALAIRSELKDRRGVGAAFTNLGISFMELSQYEKAIGYYAQALGIFRENNYRSGESQTLMSLGQAYNFLGQSEKMIDCWTQALAIFREVKDPRGESDVLNDLGVAYYSENQYDKAIDYYKQAMMVGRTARNLQVEGNALGNLGNVYNRLGQYETEISYYEQSLAIFREIENRRDEGYTLCNLGEAYFALGQYEKAASYFPQALAISREVKDRSSQAEELTGLMETWQAAGKPRLAVFYGKQAVNVIQSIRGDIRGLSQEARRSFVERNKDTYRQLTDVLVSQGRLIEAQQSLALLKQQEFYDYGGDTATAEQATRIGLTLEEADWAERYRKGGETLAETSAAIGNIQDRIKKQPSLADASDTQRQLNELHASLEGGNRSFQQFLGELKQHFDATSDAGAATSIDLKVTEALKTDLVDLKHGAVAIYTLVAPDRYVAILVTPTGQKDYQSKIKSADLNQKILTFREAIEDPHSDPRVLAQELYKILIPEALAEDLRQAKAETLMWSLDGPLRYVPVAALHDGKQYLIEKYRMAVFTPASNASLKDVPQSKWRAVALGVSEAHTGFSSLPAVADELRGIVREKPGESGVLEGRRLLDEKFTRATMDRELKGGGYAVVHVASHFQFTPGDDRRSFLLLGDGSRLTLADIKAAGAIFEGVDLLTLSACSTGLGDVKTADGSEVEGFGVLAQREGAKAVVASLWPVADASTGRLMQEFYRIRQTDSKLTKIEALRRAQLRLLSGAIKPGGVAEERGVRVGGETQTARDYRHPYYWAPFFLMGNWL